MCSPCIHPDDILNRASTQIKGSSSFQLMDHENPGVELLIRPATSEGIVHCCSESQTDDPYSPQPYRPGSSNSLTQHILSVTSGMKYSPEHVTKSVKVFYNYSLSDEIEILECPEVVQPSVEYYCNVSVTALSEDVFKATFSSPLKETKLTGIVTDLYHIGDLPPREDNEDVAVEGLTKDDYIYKYQHPITEVGKIISFDFYLYERGQVSYGVAIPECNPDLVYCYELGGCVDSCPHSQEDLTYNCPDKKLFCLHRGTCATKFTRDSCETYVEKGGETFTYKASTKKYRSIKVPEATGKEISNTILNQASPGCKNFLETNIVSNIILLITSEYFYFFPKEKSNWWHTKGSQGSGQCYREMKELSLEYKKPRASPEALSYVDPIGPSQKRKILLETSQEVVLPITYEFLSREEFVPLSDPLYSLSQCGSGHPVQTYSPGHRMDLGSDPLPRDPRDYPGSLIRTVSNDFEPHVSAISTYHKETNNRALGEGFQRISVEYSVTPGSILIAKGPIAKRVTVVQNNHHLTRNRNVSSYGGDTIDEIETNSVHLFSATFTRSNVYQIGHTCTSSGEINLSIDSGEEKTIPCQRNITDVALKISQAETDAYNPTINDDPPYYGRSDVAFTYTVILSVSGPVTVTFIHTHTTTGYTFSETFTNSDDLPKGESPHEIDFSVEVSTSGCYNVTVAAENLHNRNTQPIQNWTMLCVQHPVVTSLDLVPKPTDEDAFLIPRDEALFELTDASEAPFPENATFEISWGDGTTTKLESLTNIEDQTFSHQYLKGGIYTVTARVKNLVSESDVSCQVTIIEAIRDFSVTPYYFPTLASTTARPGYGLNGTLFPLDKNTSFFPLMSQGSVKTYTLTYTETDELIVTLETTNQFKPLAHHLSTHFNEEGVFNVTITAANVFETVSFDVSVEILGMIRGLVLDDYGIVTKQDQEKRFNVTFQTMGGQACMLVNWGDDSFVSTFGPEATCKERYFWAVHEGDHLDLENEITHVYLSNGIYNVSAVVSNPISRLNDVLMILVTDIQCTPPQVEIVDSVLFYLDAPNHKRSEPVDIPTRASLNCTVTSMTKKSWQIYRIDEATGEMRSRVENVDSLPSSTMGELTIPPYFLIYGFYQVFYTLRMWDPSNLDPYWPFQKVVYTMIHITRTDLIPIIFENSVSRVKRGRDQAVALEPGVHSIDPDFPDDKTFDITWKCRKMDEEWPDPDTDTPKPVFPKGTTSSGCFGYGPESFSGLPLGIRYITRPRDNYHHGQLPSWTNYHLGQLHPPPLSNSTQGRLLDYSDGALHLLGSDLIDSGDFFEFEVWIAKDVREERAIAQVMVEDTDVPILRAKCLTKEFCKPFPDGVYINPSYQLDMTMECISACGENLTYQWSVYDAENNPIPFKAEHFPLDNSHVQGTTRRELALSATFHEDHPEEEMIILKGSATNSLNLKGASSFFMWMNRPPTGGTCELIHPPTNIALISNYILQCTGWTDPEELPFMYKVSYCYDNTRRLHRRNDYGTFTLDLRFRRCVYFEHEPCINHFHYASETASKNLEIIKSISIETRDATMDLMDVNQHALSTLIDAVEKTAVTVPDQLQIIGDNLVGIGSNIMLVSQLSIHARVTDSHSHITLDTALLGIHARVTDSHSHITLDTALLGIHARVTDSHSHITLDTAQLGIHARVTDSHSYITLDSPASPARHTHRVTDSHSHITLATAQLSIYSRVTDSHSHITLDTALLGMHTRPRVTDSHNHITLDTALLGMHTRVTASHSYITLDTALLVMHTRPRVTDSHSHITLDTAQLGTHTRVTDSHSHIALDTAQLGTHTRVIDSHSHITLDTAQLGTHNRVTDSHSHITLDTAQLGTHTRGIFQIGSDEDCSNAPPSDLRDSDNLPFDTDIGFDIHMVPRLENAVNRLTKIALKRSLVGESWRFSDPNSMMVDTAMTRLDGEEWVVPLGDNRSFIILPKGFCPTGTCGDPVGISIVNWPYMTHSYTEGSKNLALGTRVLDVQISDRNVTTLTVERVDPPILVDVPRTLNKMGVNDFPDPVWINATEVSVASFVPVVYSIFNVSKNFSSINIEITPEHDNHRLFLIVSPLKVPTLTRHYWFTMVKDIPVRRNETYDYFIPSAEINVTGNFFAGVGEFLPDFDVSLMKNPLENQLNLTVLQNISLRYSLRTLTSGCYFFDKEEREWMARGVEVVNSDHSTTRCASNHLTSFGAGLFIPPNTIDFSFVFANIGFTDNLTIYLTLIIALSIFFILLIWARVMDRRDVKKLGATPLPDNHVQDGYLYEILVFTGNLKGAQTDSTVQFVLTGERGETEVRTFGDDKRKIFRKAGVDVFVMAIPRPLGHLEYIRVWHDNSGKGPNASWYLNYMVFRDVQTGLKYEFIANQWFALEKEDGMIERVLPVAGDEEKRQFQHLFNTTTNKNIADGHLWFSVFLRPPRSRFTRCQRVASCFALLFLSMLVNAMWYERVPEQPRTGGLNFGPFNLSPEEIGVGIISNLIVFPPSLLIVFLFRKSRPSKLRQSRIELAVEKTREEFRAKHAGATENQGTDFDGQESEKSESLTQSHKSGEDQKQNKKKKKKMTLPPFFRYLAWLIAFACIGGSCFFLLMYGVMFGNSKATKWVLSLIVSFFSSILFVQPLKIFLMAFLVSAIFKSGDHDEDDADEDEEDPRLLPNEKWMHDDTGQLLHFNSENKDLLEKLRRQRQQEVGMNEIMKEIFLYALFIWILLILSHGNRDPNAYLLQQGFHNSFVNDGYTNDNDFTQVTNTDRLWYYIYNVLLQNLRADKLYNGKPPYGLRGFLEDHYNRIMGYATIRQIRTKKYTCNVPTSMRDVSERCSGFTQIHNEDQEHYCLKWRPPTPQTINKTSCQSREFRYSTAAELEGFPKWGKLDWYSGGGYVIHLQGPTATLLDKFAELQRNRWIDNHTRAVIIEFSTYNAGVNLFGTGLLMAEYTPGGGITPTFRFEGIRLLQHLSNFGSFIIACEVGFILFIIFYTVRETRAMYKNGRAYFKNYWSYAEIAIIISSYAMMVVYGLRYKATKDVLTVFKNTFGNGYVNLNYAALLNEVYLYLVSFIGFVGTLKFIKLLRFNKKIGVLSTTLRQCWDDLAGFLMAFFLCFFSFVNMFYFLLNIYIEEFSNFVVAIETCFSMMLGKFNFQQMKEVSIIVPLMFFLFVVLNSWVLINLLLTVIIQAFIEIKHDMLKQPNEYEIVDFVWGRFKAFIGAQGAQKARLKEGQMIDANNKETLHDSPDERLEDFPEKVDKFLEYINNMYFNGNMDYRLGLKASYFSKFTMSSLQFTPVHDEFTQVHDELTSVHDSNRDNACHKFVQVSGYLLVSITHPSNASYFQFYGVRF
ncbi:polycystin-1-like [Palaemon carinicauda]|uniref:polycystin-1-like n=1 Tax=Palaemon carinicauda TaxID=392227 RepID=UPI0035B5DA1A